MLLAPHHNARCNAEGLGGSLHLLFGTQPFELQSRSRRHQLIVGEAIGFGLMRFIHSSEAIHEGGLVNQR